MIHQEASAFLDSLIDYEKITTYAYDAMKLERMKVFLSELGNPQDSFRSIHVAGSRGKGSTCAMVYSILREAGFSVGLYTSPHLVSREERIRIAKKGRGERMILGGELALLVNEVRPVLERLSKGGMGQFTFFEVFTALSFLFFRREGVEIAVLEVGMGGRLDATNVVHPLVAAVTPISYDHTDKLGMTLTEIACEKAQILKKDSLAIISHQDPEPLAEIRRVAKASTLPLLEVSSSYSYRIVEKSLEGTRFHVKGPEGDLSDLFLPLLGEHQVRNALVALAICGALTHRAIAISKGSLRRGLSKVDWPGRFQIAQRNPIFILDGAQNGASATVLKETFLDFFKDRPLCLILGISANKEVGAVCKILCPLAERVLVTQSKTLRALSVEQLRDFAASYSQRLQMIPSVQEALAVARSSVSPEGVILATGSLYLVGEIFALLREGEDAKKIAFSLMR